MDLLLNVRLTRQKSVTKKSSCENERKSANIGIHKNAGTTVQLIEKAAKMKIRIWNPTKKEINEKVSFTVNAQFQITIATIQTYAIKKRKPRWSAYSNNVINKVQLDKREQLITHDILSQGSANSGPRAKNPARQWV